MSVRLLVIGLLAGAAAGWLSGVLTKGSGFGALGNLIVGVVGAILGTFVLHLVGLTATSPLGQLIVAAAGAVALGFLLRFVRR